MDSACPEQPDEPERKPGTGEASRREVILHAELELGALLLSAGAPGQRILDSVTFLNEKLNGGCLNIFLGFEALIITLGAGPRRHLSMREYPLPSAMNGRAMMVISRYLRALPEGTDPERVIRDFKALDLKRPGPNVLTYAAIVVFTMIFGFFNHADAWALAIIGIAALVACLVRDKATGKGHRYFMAVLAATLAGTISAALLSQVIPTGTPLISLIIPCVFLIPGFQLINGGWEILRSHLHIGIPRVTVFLTVIAIIAVGLLSVLLVYTPGVDGAGILVPAGWTFIIDTLLGALAALCFCVIMNAPKAAIPVCLICGGASRLVRTVIVQIGGDVAFAVFCGTLALALVALLICLRSEVPIVIPLVAASVQFIPGYNITICLQGMARIITLGQAVPYAIIGSTIFNGMMALFIAVAIIFGTMFPLLILSKDRRWY
ncbi:MAG: threonine/serine exporter family protein [Methanoregulaceae archaeon]